MENAETGPKSARYVYGVIPDIGIKDLPLGIEGNPVYAISYRDLCAVVHDCPAEPYQGDETAIKGMVATHSDVVDAIWEASGTVLPMSFDVIVKPDEERSADDNVRQWLKEGYDKFKLKLGEFRDKVELGIQILWDPEGITRRITEENAEIKKLAIEMASKPRGMAYFYQHKISEAVKKEIEAKADQDYRRYYERLRGYAEDTQVNKIKRHRDRQMIMNLSLLVKRDRMEALGRGLAEIREEEGVEVRFTGPWPPYTFASKIAALGGEVDKHGERP